VVSISLTAQSRNPMGTTVWQRAICQYLPQRSRKWNSYSRYLDCQVNISVFSHIVRLIRNIQRVDSNFKKMFFCNAQIQRSKFQSNYSFKRESMLLCHMHSSLKYWLRKWALGKDEGRGAEEGKATGQSCLLTNPTSQALFSDNTLI
jgi:hypothetical protein